MDNLHRTREGKLIPISEMTNSHLLNTIAFFQSKLKPLLKEQAQRGLDKDPRALLRAARRVKNVDLSASARFGGLDIPEGDDE